MREHLSLENENEVLLMLQYFKENSKRDNGREVISVSERWYSAFTTNKDASVLHG